MSGSGTTSKDGALKRLLCQLADPQKPAPSTEELLSFDPQQLFDAITHHGIAPVALPKLVETLPQEPPYVGLIDSMRESQFLANAHCLNLEAVAKRVMLAIDRAGLQATLVKGPVFTVALYDRASDRPFTDVDILVHRSAAREIGVLLKDAGFNRRGHRIWHRSASNLAQKWVGRDDPSVLVELHGNLVHYAGLRRRVSFGYDEYRTASGNGEFPAVANFMTAVIHASAGHKFHRLQLLVDVLQALRRLDETDVEHLVRVLPQLRARLEVLLCLDLVDVLFDEPAAKRVMERLSAGRDYRHSRRLVTADAIIDTWSDTGRRSKVRRHAFRWMQHIARRD